MAATLALVSAMAAGQPAVAAPAPVTAARDTAVVVPDGFRPSDGTPTSLTFLGRLFGEVEALQVADAYQKETGHHLKRPPAALLAGKAPGA